MRTSGSQHGGVPQFSPADHRSRGSVETATEGRCAVPEDGTARLFGDDEALLDSIQDGLRAIEDAELAIDVADMIAHRLLADL